MSWGIALPEYALQLPANRIGHAQFSAAQLKIIQEVISLTILGLMRLPIIWLFGCFLLFLIIRAFLNPTLISELKGDLVPTA